MAAAAMLREHQEEVRVKEAREKEKQALAKALIPRLPKEQQEIFAYAIDWDAVQKFEVVQRIARPWVAKKIKEYLGVEEPGMIRLVVELLETGQCTPDTLLQKVQSILDDVSEIFVKKLWQVLIFEQLKIEAGIYD